MTGSTVAGQTVWLTYTYIMCRAAGGQFLLFEQELVFISVSAAPVHSLNRHRLREAWREERGGTEGGREDKMYMKKEARMTIRTHRR